MPTNPTPPAVADIVNQALRGAGSRRRISDMYDGSEAANTALEVYGQTRNELLRSANWPFATRAVSLTLLKGPPPPGGFNPVTPWTTAYAPPGWRYEYHYPADCLELTAVRWPPGLMPARDPRPAVFKVYNDAVLGQKVIAANVTNAIGIYRGFVIDPNLWEAGFIATLIAALTKKFAIALTQNAELMKLEAQETQVIGIAADRQRG